ncbi:MAG: hypothetical protein WBP81_32240 [Solirubrobacteraceae bacterium]
MTPAEKWATSAAPLDLVEPERLRWMLLADQTDAVVQARHEAWREMGRRKAAASRKARARIAPLTATGTVQDITAIVRDRAHDRESAQQDAEKGELLEILGLADQLNKPIPPSSAQEDAGS